MMDDQLGRKRCLISRRSGGVDWTIDLRAVRPARGSLMYGRKRCLTVRGRGRTI